MTRAVLMTNVVSFGFEIVNLNGNGADAYFPVANKMTLNAFNIDAAFMLTAPPSGPGFAEVLCQGRVARGGPPKFSASVAAYLPFPASPDFGTVEFYNPDNLQVIGNGTLSQDLFYSVILKSWVPADGTASATSRQVAARPSLALDAGDYLAFHMDHAGVSVDCELQVVLEYTPA